MWLVSFGHVLMVFLGADFGMKTAIGTTRVIYPYLLSAIFAFVAAASLGEVLISVQFLCRSESETSLGPLDLELQGFNIWLEVGRGLFCFI